MKIKPSSVNSIDDFDFANSLRGDGINFAYLDMLVFVRGLNKKCELLEEE